MLQLLAAARVAEDHIMASPEKYGSELAANQSNSHPDPNRPPVGMTIDTNAQTIFTLPKASITVLRGKLSN